MPMITSRPEDSNLTCQTGGAHGCSKSGHKVKHCSTTKKAVIPTKTSTGNWGSASRRTKRGKKDIECCNCHEKGHYSSHCPHNAMFCGLNNTQQKAGVMRSGTVEGKYLNNILIDTGYLKTLAHWKLVTNKAFLEGRDTTVCCTCCTHGDTMLYPLAKVHIEVEGKPIKVEAAVSDRLPVGVLLGTDVSQLLELFTQQNSGVVEPEKAMVMTREAVPKQKEQEAEPFFPWPSNMLSTTVH